MQTDGQSLTKSGAQMVPLLLEQQELDAVERLANISHVLRSPLTAIKGYAELLLCYEQQLSQQERQEFLQTIKAASDKLAKTIDDLLEGSPAQRQQKKYRQEMAAYRQQQAELEERRAKLRERHHALQARIELLHEQRQSLMQRQQEFERIQHEWQEWLRWHKW